MRCRKQFESWELAEAHESSCVAIREIGSWGGHTSLTPTQSPKNKLASSPSSPGLAALRAQHRASLRRAESKEEACVEPAQVIRKSLIEYVPSGR